MRAAAASISAFLGLGFGIPGIAGLNHFARTGEVWTFVGFPTYGQGPFERLGIPTSTPLLAGFVAVCLAELVLGGLIATETPGAKVASAALLPVEMGFWVGFALPFGPPLGVARVLLLLRT